MESMHRLRTREAARRLAVARRVGTVLLFAWFAWHTYDRISFFVDRQFPVGLDATIYYRGIVAWLSGLNPWDAAVEVGGFAYHYAGSPVTTVIMAPAALVSEEVFTFGWVVLTWGATIWTLRRLGFPLWWLLFPPIAEALFSANPQLVVLALLVANHWVASAVATALKVYAFIPLFGEARWRQIAVAVAFSAATFIVAPGLWFDYFRQFGAISSRLEYESLQGLSAFYFPVLLAVTVVALADPRPSRSTRRGPLAGRSGGLALEPVPLLDDGAAGHVAADGGAPLDSPPAVAAGRDHPGGRSPADRAVGQATTRQRAITFGRGATACQWPQSRWKISSRRWWNPVAGSVSGSISDAISACQRSLTGLAAIAARNAAKSSTSR